MKHIKRDGMEIYKRIEYNTNKRKKESYKKLIDEMKDLRINDIR
jgi:hypothetical protein